VGGDLAHIFCSKSAAPSIKSYSPEVIVHPVFVSETEVKLTADQLKEAHEEWLGRILAWKAAINAWVIGPGLGRDRYMKEFFPILIKNLPEGSLVVLDADAIYFLSKHPELLPELKRLRTILTPNAREMTFLRTIM
jgi:ATP-dependent NAD(P)H-hydrate dehydratase